MIDPAIDGAWERLGVSGILVLVAFFLVKYFIGQLAAVHSQKDRLTELFIEATRLQSTVIATNSAEMVRSRDSHEKLSDAVRELTDAVRARRG